MAQTIEMEDKGSKVKVVYLSLPCVVATESLVDVGLESSNILRKRESLRGRAYPWQAAVVIGQQRRRRKGRTIQVVY